MYAQTNHPIITHTYSNLVHRRIFESKHTLKGWLLTGLRISLASSSLFLSGCITVDSVVDSLDANPGDGVCEDSANRCTLRAAIMESTALSFKNTIMVPAGIYSLTLPAASGGGALTITKDIRIRGAGAESTVVEQTHDNPVIWIQGGNDIEIDLLTVQGGDTSAGGGIRIDDGTVEIEDLTIRDNFGFTGGGGLLVSDSAVVRMWRSTVTKNNATGAFGGGIWNQGELWIYDSTISNNDSNRAGGIRNSGNMNLRNVTVSGNTVHSPTAGVGGISQNGFAVLNNVTVTNNSGVGNNMGSFRGGGIQTSSGKTTVMKNSIAAGNNGNGGPDDCVGQLTADSKYNLIGNTSDCTITSFLSTYLLNVPANLGPLSNNGGATQTHLLQASSFSRDAGYQFPPPAADACEARDQRGVPRPQGTGACDLGALEHTQANLFVTGLVLVDAGTNTDIRLIRNDDIIFLNTLPAELSIRAIVTGVPGSVEFGFDSEPSIQIENISPYALGGDASGDFSPVAFAVGEHTVIATPFTDSDGTGQAGGAIVVRFDVSSVIVR